MNLFLAFSVLSGTALSLKISMLSDVHILPKYDPLANNTCFCNDECPLKQKIDPSKQSSQYAPLGRLYCDPPQILTQAFIQKVASDSPDLLVITGDIIGHTYS
jgi:predicted MPP superfamily phosphohydrolase